MTPLQQEPSAQAPWTRMMLAGRVVMRSPSPWIDRHRSRHNAASLSVKQAVERIAQTCRFFSRGGSSLLAVCLRDDAGKGPSGRGPELIEDVTEVAAHPMTRPEH